MRRIYIAGRYEARDRLRGERNRMNVLGAGRVVGTWLDEEPAQESLTPQQAYDYAVRDRKELACDADLLILDTFDDDDRGGREVEYGIALGYTLAAKDHERIETWVVGPKRNIFHELAPHFETWDQVLDALMDEGNGNR